MSCSAAGPGHTGPLAGPPQMSEERLERADPQSVVLQVMEHKEGVLEVTWWCMDMKRGDKHTEGQGETHVEASEHTWGNPEKIQP